jgi:ElaB/YqjD/DUF883 family membrane-anchored ribosome-binding protein
MSSVANQTVVRLKDFRNGEVADRVSNALHAFSTQVADSVQDWRGKAGTAAKSADGFVRSNPWQTVGAVALAAVASGVLVSWSAERARRARARDLHDATAETLGG